MMRALRGATASSSAFVIGLVLSVAAGCGDDSAGDYAESGDGSESAAAGGYQPPAPVAPPVEEPESAPACSSLDATQPVVLYLSADDSNSMASPAEARELIREGATPASVRTYEFLNYYDVGFPAPAYPDLALFADAAPAAEAGAFDLMLAVRAHDAPALRRPMTITFVADTSGSMEGTPMDRERAAMRAIAGQMTSGDIVSVVTWNTENLVELDGHVVAGPNDPALLEVINRLSASGGTDLDGGLRAGYDLARANYGADRLNRVVMISDGGANVGQTSADIIGEASDDADAEGIYLVGVGTGPIYGYSDALMDVVTDKGRGAYVYLDSTEEAERVFGARFDETMEVAARDVRIEVTLPWYFQMLRFYGEEYSENPEEVDPQHLAPGDVTVVMQTIRACDPSVVNEADAVRLRATWLTPLGRQPREIVLDTTLGAMRAQDHARLNQAKAIVAFAEALKTPSSTAVQDALREVEPFEQAGAARFDEIAGLLRQLPSN